MCKDTKDLGFGIADLAIFVQVKTNAQCRFKPQCAFSLFPKQFYIYRVKNLFSEKERL